MLVIIMQSSVVMKQVSSFFCTKLPKRRMKGKGFNDVEQILFFRSKVIIVNFLLCRDASCLACLKGKPYCSVIYKIND